MIVSYQHLNPIYNQSICFVYITSMEVLNEYAALLSNAEVLSILENFKKNLKEPKYTRQNLNEMNKQLSDKEKNLQSLNTIVYETIKYLEETPCATQAPEHIQNFLGAISSYNLTKGEKLQIINLRPTSLVQIQLLIEESEERFTEDQLNEILTVVAETLPPGPETDSTAPSEADFDENG